VNRPQSNASRIPAPSSRDTTKSGARKSAAKGTVLHLADRRDGDRRKAGKSVPPKQRFNLVLGAGGMVGLAYHAGVLRALNDRFGLVANDAELIVGTSAGSVVAAYIRAGWSLEDLWDLAVGSHASLEAFGGDPDSRRASMAFQPNFTSALEFAQRAIGSYYVTARSFIGFPMPRIPDSVQKFFRAGLFTMKSAEQQFHADLGAHWPTKPVALCAYDVGSGHRAVFSAAGSRRATVPQAIVASCAIPGFYNPCQIDGRLYVDGGVHSSTNLDLAARQSGGRVIVIAPMSFHPDSRLDATASLMRRIPQRQLNNELAVARRRKVSVLAIRPTAVELREHGSNLMKPGGGQQIAELAYEQTMSRTDLADFFLTNVSSNG
jgi:NTE family protein